jgi:integrase
MPRPATGNVRPRQLASGLTYYMRFKALGEQWDLNADTADQSRARARLDEILDQVKRDTWVPPQAIKPKVRITEPTFGQFASDVWWPDISSQLGVKGQIDYQWQLEKHLRPYFGEMFLSEIDIKAVDAYRNHKVSEDRLGTTSINKTITRLGQILDLAMEHHPGVLPANPARGKRRRLPPITPRRSFLEADQVLVVLDAAGALDIEARADRQRIGRRAMMATLMLAGLRVGELCELLRSDVDLAGGKLYVREKPDTEGKAKTEAGVRVIPISGFLHDELTAYLAQAIDSRWMFPTATGNQRDVDNLRNRTHNVVIKRANQMLAREGRPLIQEGLTPHGLRRTFITLLLEAGENIRLVMAWAGHTDPSVTMKIYAQVLSRPGSRRKAQELLWEPGAWNLEADLPADLDRAASVS